MQTECLNLLHIAYETAVRNLQMHSFTGDAKSLIDPQQTNNEAFLLRKYKGKLFFFNATF
jgi:hypothetical protein